MNYFYRVCHHLLDYLLMKFFPADKLTLPDLQQLKQSAEHLNRNEQKLGLRRNGELRSVSLAQGTMYTVRTKEINGE